jgi:hypothetical protein
MGINIVYEDIGGFQFQSAKVVRNVVASHVSFLTHVCLDIVNNTIPVAIAPIKWRNWKMG